jgi:uncharacterized protein (DUF433 family)
VPANNYLGDSFLGIEVMPGICGGEPCISHTRIPVWVLVRAREIGASEADILRSYPMLQAGDLANAWGFARSHSREIQIQIRENEEA